MELTPAQLVALQTLTVAANKLPTDRLSVGQQLLATIIATDAKSGEVVLNINNAILNAKTSLPLKVNQTLPLLVAQTGNQVTLKLQDNALHSLITEQAMRQVLPQQQPINVAIRHIQQVLQQRPSTSISPKLIQLANQFIRQLPTVQQLSGAEGVKSAFINSGLFLEKNLKRMVNHHPTVNLTRDIKSLFINLKQALAQQKAVVENTSSRPENTNTAKQTLPTNANPPQRIIIASPEKAPAKLLTPSTPPPSQPPASDSGQTKAIKTDRCYAVLH